MDNMETKIRIICTEDLIDGLTKDKVYEINSNEAKELYYGIIDDNGEYCRCRANNFINTKQVVVVGSDNCSGLLTPYYMVEYFKRKGKELFVFDEDKVVNYKYYLIDNNKLFSDYNNFTRSYYSINYSYTSTVGDLISPYDLLDEISREDEVLIQMVKEINNQMYLKIIDIPFNVKYDIKQWECSLGEYISEKHRTWC